MAMRTRAPLWLSLFVSSTALLACAHGAAPAPAPRASAPPRDRTPASAFGAPRIDAALRAAWAKEGVVPAGRADDATFLRRVYIDVTGTIPPPDVAASFLDDRAADKRAKLVDTLVASQAYADHWATYWDDVLMGKSRLGQAVDRAAFRRWLVGRFTAREPWDRIVSGLVAATGQSSSPPMGEVAKADEPPEDGAVNWTLRFREAPQDLAGSASRVFLGVQIQCAQCHDHKTEAWTQDDFRGFASPFLRARFTPIDKTKGMQRFALGDEDRAPPRYAKSEELGPIARAKPRALDGTSLEAGKDTRRALAAWMTSPQNPWFARALVNRMWGHFLGRGFVDPVDDMRPSNPAVLPELLDALAADFTSHGYDLGHLVRSICATEAYQLAASRDAKTDPENKLWGRFHLVPLGSEELLNAVLRATRIEDAAARVGLPNVEQLRAQLEKQIGFLFDVDEEDDTPDYEGTVSQALALLNGGLVGNGARAVPGSAVADALAAPGDDASRVERLALQVLSRRPTPAEKEAWLAYVRAPDRAAAPPPSGGRPRDPSNARKPSKGGTGPLAKLDRKPSSAGDPRRAAYEDLVWAWLNSSEFVFNH
jgi:hypothetical protein